MDRSDRRPCSVTALACQPMTIPPPTAAVTNPIPAEGAGQAIHWASLSRSLHGYALAVNIVSGFEPDASVVIAVRVIKME